MSQSPSAVTATAIVPTVIADPDMRFSIDCFGRFSLLPLELQSMIWLEAVRHTPSQVVVLTSSQTHDEISDQDEEDDDPPSTFCKHAHKAPALLHACQSSRYAALQRFEVCFTGQLASPLYFDMELDTLLFTDIYLFKRFESFCWAVDTRDLTTDSAKFTRIRKVAICIMSELSKDHNDLLDGYDLADAFCREFLDLLESLKYIKILKPSRAAYENGVLPKYSSKMGQQRRKEEIVAKRTERGYLGFKKYLDTIRKSKKGDPWFQLYDRDSNWGKMTSGLDFILPSLQYETFEEMQDCRWSGDSFMVNEFDQKRYCEAGEEVDLSKASEAEAGG